VSMSVSASWNAAFIQLRQTHMKKFTDDKSLSRDLFACINVDFNATRSRYTVKKYPYIDGYYVARSSYFYGTGSVYVSIHNDAQAHTAMCASASLFRRFTDTNVYRTGSVKIRKTCHKISVDVRIIFIVLIDRNVT